MRRLKLPAYFILFILGLTISLTSCSYKHYKGFKKIVTTGIALPDIFDSTFKKANYLTYFEVFGNELSGITIIKKVEQTNTYHVVFISQIGLKYFDLEMTMDQEANGFKMNYIMESLNRDFIVNALKDDFELLFIKKSNNRQIQLYQHPEKETREITVSHGKEITSYLIENELVRSVSLIKGLSNLASININKFNTNYPQKFEMINKKARLKTIMNEIVLE